MAASSETPKHISPKKDPKVYPGLKTSLRGEYILDKATNTVSSIRIRLDRLIFILLIVSLYGLILSFSTKAEITVPLGVEVPIPREAFSLLIAVVLTGIFTLIGATLIDYIRKRSLLEIYAKDVLPEIPEDEQADILVHASFYEFMYELDIYKGELRLPASLLLLLIFYFSHGIAILQIFNCFGGDNPIPYLITLVLLAYFSALYRTFVRSAIKSKASLGNEISRLLWLSLLVTGVVLALFATIMFFIK